MDTSSKRLQVRITLHQHASFVCFVLFCFYLLSFLFVMVFVFAFVFYYCIVLYLINKQTGHKEAVLCVAPGAGGKEAMRLVTGSCDGTLIVWDMLKCHNLGSLEGHSGYVVAGERGRGRGINRSRGRKGRNVEREGTFRGLTFL